MPSPSILVTGATGLLGSYLIRDLLARDVPLAVLARPSRKQSARDRVEALVAGWETCLGRPLPRPTGHAVHRRVRRTKKKQADKTIRADSRLTRWRHPT